MPIPPNAKIYHITHVENLPGIIRDGFLWSDAERIAKDLECSVVGMSAIKERRLALPVKCHPGTHVGDYVPFYFCPRSIMLYILHMANHPELTYRGGQGPIVHLEADLQATIDWAGENHVRWAFSDRNAGAFVADFFKRKQDLTRVNWQAVGSTVFRDPVIKEGKQAEFLLFGEFPWELVQRIGVLTTTVRSQATEAIDGGQHQPPVEIQTGWYY